MKMNVQAICVTVLMIVLVPEPAHAYVDPGFLGALYQMVYMFVFGVLAVWVMKPFKLMAAFFRKMKARFKIGDSE